MTLLARICAAGAALNAAMLARMYVRWSVSHGYKVEMMEYQAGDQAGIKSATMQIKGENAYGYAKTESGVHRLVRISPFDSAGKRHTYRLPRP